LTPLDVGDVGLFETEKVQVLIVFDIQTLLDRIHAAGRRKKEKEETIWQDF
jgi:hypothetical protein